MNENENGLTGDPGHENSSNDEHREQDDRRNITEELFTVFSVLLIISVCGYLGFQSFGIPTPPVFSVETSYPLPRGDLIAVEVYVKNSGEEAAKAVHVTAEMTGNNSQPVDAEATLDWLPGNSKRRVTMVFPGDVVTTTLPNVKIKGYEQP